MKAVDKNQLLDALENKVEKHLEQAIRVYQNLPAWQLLQPAATGGWSIAQCLDHLNSYGHYYLPRIQAGLAQQRTGAPAGTFQSTWLGAWFTRSMDPATGKKKYKALKGHIPAASLDAAAVVAEFILQQEELLACLSGCRQANLNAIKIPLTISRWIRLRVGDVLQFLIAHNERHVQQANRNLIAEYSPQPAIPVGRVVNDAG